ncbi:TIR domain-containing protein [Nitrosococcus wardiae]|uniref:Molecular chaperone Tir n=1 Tax=Nitrosococcus wardiae TaxID=1814290 RepID=A0A4P7C390_9GAMM|nr:TIR domain-containing protein [Nitrosococcus wardiae]QBQ56190.1 molecular chaperone Tir [Nitrosococcus wardiae]
MPQVKIYRLFISHSWAYGDAYDKLVSFFKKHSNFQWVDYSVPKNDPIHNAPNDKALYEAIKNQMRFANCVVILAGVYSTYSKWINKEIEIAKQVFSKPLIAIEPWVSEKTSKIVKDNADSIVKWQSSSIVNAIRNHSV